MIGQKAEICFFLTNHKLGTECCDLRKYYKCRLTTRDVIVPGAYFYTGCIQCQLSNKENFKMSFLIANTVRCPISILIDSKASKISVFCNLF